MNAEKAGRRSYLRTSSIPPRRNNEMGVAYRVPATSANLFAVSVTMSILRCSLFCSSGIFTLSVTR
jgi:hypothetical protein